VLVTCYSTGFETRGSSTVANRIPLVHVPRPTGLVVKAPEGLRHRVVTVVATALELVDELRLDG